MNWPAFALITYAFIMALLLAVFVVRSLRETKGRYQRILEEKEQKLAAMQLDLEETLEALEERAIALEADLTAALKRDGNASAALMQQMLDVQRGMTSLQSRMLRLEHRPTMSAPKELLEPDPSVDAPKQVRPIPTSTLSTPVLEEKLALPIQPKQTEVEEAQAQPSMTLRERTLFLLQSGMSIAEIAKQTGQSHTEITLLFNQWNKGRAKRDEKN